MSELQKSVEQSDAGTLLISGPEEHASVELPFGSASITLGQRLLDARKSRGLSVADVAQAIKFSPRQIEAIERDDFDKLPGTTFVRGFIRSYAKLLHLDSIPLLAMFEKQVPQSIATMHVPQDTGTALPQAGERRSPVSYQWFLLILVAIAVAVAAYFNWPKTQTNSVAENKLVAPPSPAVVEPPVAARTEPARQDVQAMQNEQAGQSAQPLGPDIHQLIFVFEGKSWVEVKDATQRVIFAQNNEPGTRQVVNGKPPFALVIGNVSHVQLLYEERQIDLLPYTKVDVARLTLE